MNEIELLLIRLEDLSESAENKEVKILAKALNRYFTKTKNAPVGFNK